MRRRDPRDTGGAAGASRADGPGTGQDERGEGGESDGPERALACEGDDRLDEERIGEEGDEAAGVAGDVEEVRIGGTRVAGAREPALEGGCTSREGEEGHAVAKGERGEEPRGWRGTGGAVTEPDGEGGTGEAEERDMEPRAKAGACGDGVCPGVSGEECGLEEEHRSGPDRGAAAEAREEFLGGHGLDEEEEKGAEEDGDGEEGEHGKREYRRCGERAAGWEEEGIDGGRRPTRIQWRRTWDTHGGLMR